MFKNSDRRNDLDKAYHHLIRALFDNVERMAEEHQRTPRAVVMMGKSVSGEDSVGFTCLVLSLVGIGVDDLLLSLLCSVLGDPAAAIRDNGIFGRKLSPENPVVPTSCPWVSEDGSVLKIAPYYFWAAYNGF